MDLHSGLLVRLACAPDTIHVPVVVLYLYCTVYNTVVGIYSVQWLVSIIATGAGSCTSTIYSTVTCDRG
jgi:hypothetical protein